MGQRYLQVDVQTDRPEALVAKLLRKAIQCVRLARDPATKAAERTRAISRSLQIVSELRNGLDLEAGGEIARNLDALYVFASNRLLAAPTASETGPMEDVLRVLEPLGEAWAEIAGQGSGPGSGT